MSRIFLAIVPEGLEAQSELQRLLGKLKRTLREREVISRWVPPDLWHVTLHFLGEITDAERARLLEVLSVWRPSFQLTLRLQGLGAFPVEAAARVLWLGVQENQEFLNLQRELGSLLKTSGFILTEREFRPHLTLARLRNPHGVGDLLSLGGRKHFGDYEVRELVVFESVVQGQMAKYVAQARFAL